MGSSYTIIHGRLTADPEEKTYNKADGSTGTMVIFAVAVDARFGDNTYYYDCSAFGKMAELIKAHFHKGKEIIVQGEHIYKEKDKKRFWTLNVDRFDFCGSKDVTVQGDSMQAISDDTPF